MKFNSKNRIVLMLTLVSGLVFTQCTDLEEEVLDEVLGGESLTPASTLAAAYDRLGDGTFVDNGGMHAMQEYTTDVALLPTRGSDWGDGGKWRAMHEFTWTSSTPAVVDNWNRLSNGVTRALTAINASSNSDDSEAALFLAESRGLLNFYLYQMLDLYGQAPYRDPLDLNAELEVLHAAEAIDILIANVETLIPDLASLNTQSTHTGRFTKEAAYALLSEMYLNRAVYKDRYNASSAFDFNEASLDAGKSDMDKVIEYTSLLINSGTFSLESNYFQNFNIGNAGGSEHIFAVVQMVDQIRNGDNDLGYVCQARNQRPSPGNRGTNAACTTPEFFHSWDGNQDDPRFSRKYQYSDGTWFMNDGTTGSVPVDEFVPGTENPWFHFNRGFLHGQQYGPILDGAGGFIMTADGRIEVSPLFMEKSADTPMDFTPELNFDNPSEAIFKQNQINEGVRIFKFEFDPESGNGASKVDIPLYRLGGIYTLRAEAYFRKGQTALALTDINTLRTSRTREELYGSVPGTAITSLDEEVLFKEIGYELYWEMHRRPQMIRFGKFDLAYTAKPASEPYRRVFPIPQQTLDVSDAFTQNKDYN